MFQKIMNHPLFRSYLALPLWSKIAIPVGAFLIVSWVLGPLIKLGLIVAAIGVAAYFLLRFSEGR